MTNLLEMKFFITIDKSSFSQPMMLRNILRRLSDFHALSPSRSYKKAQKFRDPSVKSDKSGQTAPVSYPAFSALLREAGLQISAKECGPLLATPLGSVVP